MRAAPVRVAAVAAGVAVLLAGCSKGRPMDGPGADYMGYATVEEMAEASTFVVEAQVQSSRTEDVGLFGVTVYSSEVVAVHTGDIDVGEVVEVLSSGGLHGYATDNDLDDGATYLLFLTDRHDPDYFPLNPIQAVYLVDGDTYVPLEQDNTIGVTAAELAHL